MFFFLSKTVTFLTMPLVIVCALLILAAFLRSRVWKHRLFVTGVALLLFFSNDFIANECMRAWEVPPTPIADIHKTYAWGVVLSGVVKSDMQPNDRVYFQRGADRVLHAFQLYKSGLIRKILVSGGSGKLLGSSEDEAKEIASVLVMMGTPPEDIQTEGKSRNTHESAVAATALLRGKATPEECILITSAFHMVRASGCFRKAGYAMDTFSTDFLSHARVYSMDTMLIPHVEAIGLWHVLIKEWTGYVAYSLAGYI